MWFPCGSIITYLFACSNPSMTFISSSCRCTTMAELAKILAAGCLSLRTPSGSSGTWTGLSKLLFWGLISCNAPETALVEDERFCEIKGEPSSFLGIRDGSGGGRYVLRGPWGTLVAEVAFDGGRTAFRSNTPRCIVFWVRELHMRRLAAIEDCRARLPQSLRPPCLQLELAGP